MQRALGGRIYYGWVVVAVTVLMLLASAGVRSAPGVLIHPLEVDLGWDRAAISFSVSIGLLLFGLVGPVVGWLADRFGPRRLMLAGLVLVGASTAASSAMTALWQLDLYWGVLSGIGTGMAATVLGTTIANRWFVARRGLVLGLFGAATSAGQLVFVPLLMWLIVRIGWRTSTLLLAGATLVVLVPVLLLMRDDPADLGLQPYGGAAPAASPARVTGAGRGEPPIIVRAVRVPEFWLLAGSFFICGASSNGLVGTHLIPHSIDHGIPQVTAAGVVALMGAMNFVGTVASGWLTDRYDPRKLLLCYYGFRGLSLLLLPFLTTFQSLTIFAVLFGLDYIATVPPTSTLVAEIFGRRHVGAVFGWVFCAHQLGAALAAYLGGWVRTALGDYTLAFMVAGALAMTAGVMALCVNRAPKAFAGVAPAA